MVKTIWKFAVFFLVLWTATSVQGATLTVCDSGCDYTSIQNAINSATAGDTIDIAAGTYTEAGITVDKNLTFQGAGASSTIVQAAATEGTATDRVFNVTGGDVTLKDMTIRYGVSPSGDPCGSYDHGGAGIKNVGGALTIESCVITHNTGAEQSGAGDDGTGFGVFSAGDLSINNSTISYNSSHPNSTGDDGAGISHTSDSGSTSCVITNSTVSNNSAAHYTGGIFLFPSAGGETVTITNCTITGNSAGPGSGIGGGGGGIFSTHDIVNISFSTISDNTADYGSGGGIYQNGGTITLKNNIIAGNTGARASPAGANDGGNVQEGGTEALNNNMIDGFSVAGTFPNPRGSFTTQGGNILGDNTGVSSEFPEGSPNANGDYVGTAASPVDPFWDNLADNGGPTQTPALQDGSPALDAANGCTDVNGDDVTTDQRGYSRPTSGCDIGAYEFNDADLSIAKTVNQSAPLVGDQVIYTISVTNSGPSDALSVKVNDQLPSGVSYVSDDSGGDYDSETGVWTVGALNNGASATMNITVSADTDGTVTNQAEVTSSSNADPDPSNNQASVAMSIGGDADTDLDGVSDSVENAGPNNGDANNDGILDSLQNYVTTLQDITGHWCTLESIEGLDFSNVQAIDNPSPDNTPANTSFPFGFFGFHLNGVPAGEIVNIDLILHQMDESIISVSMYGPTPVIQRTIGTPSPTRSSFTPRRMIRP